MKPYPKNKKYLVSRFGCVWSPRTRQFMRTHPDNCGYLHISFYRNGKRTTRLLHRVILETFRGPCPEGMEALHNDSVKNNNALSNLRWGTKKENMEDLRKRNMECGGPNSAVAKLTPYDVNEIRKLIKQGISQRHIGEMFDIDKSAISRINTRKLYKWVKETTDES